MQRVVAVAGAGLSGAVVARRLADDLAPNGFAVEVFDPRDHVAGNCHTVRHGPARSGVMVHRYGPHIFHTGSDRVWAYVNRFADMVPYEHRVRAHVGDREFALPVNLTTINEFFGTEMTPAQAEAFVREQAAPYGSGSIETFESAALATIGPALYEAFFAGYTAKQWGIEPADLPASVFRRLPVRFTDDDRYFEHPHQAIPRHGYTDMIERVLDHPAITVRLGTPLAPTDRRSFDHVVWTGPIDEFFDLRAGPLRYRTIDFTTTTTTIDRGFVQPCAVVNECDRSVATTRATEFGHFTSWEQHDVSVVTAERPRDREPADIPYYPVHLATSDPVLAVYRSAAASIEDVTFVGRLGTFRYLDMDVAIGEALDAADRLVAQLGSG
jgi:UDP-galactopyranose mutase